LSLHGGTPTFTCLVPFLPSFTIFLGLGDGFSQNWLCFFDCDWNQVSTCFGVIYVIHATFGHCDVAPMSPYKRCQWCQQPKNFIKHNKG
jgi:hypothetical protein